MPPAEQTLAAAQRDQGPVGAHRAILRGWGGGEGVSADVLRARSIEDLLTGLELVRAPSRKTPGAIVRGLGRSYGDAAQLSNGLVIDTNELQGVELDRRRGVVTAGAGVTLAALLERLVPDGWLVPVLPGTQHVTVGGAIASDIHGKNHGVAGTFGTHVRSLRLLSASGDLLELRPGDELFDATLGGMGLTGIIVSAEVALRAVGGPLLSVDTDRFQAL